MNPDAVFECTSEARCYYHAVAASNATFKKDIDLWLSDLQACLDPKKAKVILLGSRPADWKGKDVFTCHIQSHVAVAVSCLDPDYQFEALELGKAFVRHELMTDVAPGRLGEGSFFSGVAELRGIPFLVLKGVRRLAHISGQHVIAFCTPLVVATTQAKYLTKYWKSREAHGLDQIMAHSLSTGDAYDEADEMAAFYLADEIKFLADVFA